MLMRVRLQAVCTPHVQTGLSTEEEEEAALHVHRNREKENVKQIIMTLLHF